MEKLKYKILIGLLSTTLIIIIFLCFKSCSDQKEISAIKIQESNLRKALTDTVHRFKTAAGDWGVEKRTLQTELSTLKDNNQILTADQKQLIKEVERVNKSSTTIAAALIQMQAEINQMKNDKPKITDSTVNFSSSSTDLKYDLTVYNVKPIELNTPSLLISNISLPNTQTINFNWADEQREGYPVSFNVINTNQYFKVYNIESYAIPEIKKTELKPSFWNSLNKFSKTTGGKMLFFGVGLATGVLIAK
ncbi:MAG: hypothetical protein ACK5PC_06215 [Cyclobacteriaceae bacterium]|jgi:alanyl-tRNA synthetase